MAGFKAGGNLKRFILSLVFLSLVFASVSHHVEDRATLYQNPILTGDAYVEQDLSFDVEMKVSAAPDTIVLQGDRSDLESGDVICPGNIIIEVDGSGKWADNYFRAVQSMTADYEDCIVSSSWPGNPKHDYSIIWNWNNYDILSNIDMCESHESCWGKEGSLENQKIKKVYIWYGEDPYENKEGKISTLCKGSLSAIVNRVGGSQVFSGDSAIENIRPFKNIYLIAPHDDSYTYSIFGSMDVSGCAVTVRPAGDCKDVTHEFINSKTDKRDMDTHYTNSISIPEIRLKVTEDPYFDFDFPGVDLPSGCLDLLPGDSIPFSFVFSNSAESVMDLVIEEIEVRGFIGLENDGTPIYDDTIEFTYETNAINLVLRPGVSTEVTGTLSASDGTLPNEVEYLQFIVHYRSYAEGCDGKFLSSWFPFNIRLCEVEHGPDLVPEIWINDRHVEIGDELQIPWRVSNIGEDPSPETKITFYDIDDSTFDELMQGGLEVNESTEDPESFLRFKCTEETKGIHQVRIVVHPVEDETNTQNNYDSTDTFFCGSPTCSITPEEVEITKRGEAWLTLRCSTGTNERCYRTEIVLLPYLHSVVTFFEVEWEPVSGPPAYADPDDSWWGTIVYGHEEAEKGDSVTIRATVFDPAFEEFVDTPEEATAVCEAKVNITDIPCEDYV